MPELKATPFLMFQGEAKPALALYSAIFPGFEEIMLEEHSDPALAGQIALARISIGGQEIMITDSAPIHDFTFTPSSSMFIECEDEEQLEEFAQELGDKGEFLMPVDTYGFSQLFAWVNDRFGVSWQLNLAKEPSDAY